MIFELLNLFYFVELLEAFEQTLVFLLFFMSIVAWLEEGLLPAICPPVPLKNGTPLLTLFLLYDGLFDAPSLCLYDILWYPVLFPVTFYSLLWFFNATLTKLFVSESYNLLSRFKWDELRTSPCLDELNPPFKDDDELTLGALTPWTCWRRDDICLL